MLLRRAFALPLTPPISPRALPVPLPVQAPCRTRDVAPLASGVAAVHVRFCATAAVLLRLRSPHLRALTPSRPHALLAQAVFWPVTLALASFARPMTFYLLFAFLALCSGQTVSPTTSPSPSPTPCSAPPGYFCSGGSALICPIGAYCAGGSALNVSCYPVTACTVAGLSAQPPCYWNVKTLAGSGAAGSANGQGTTASFSSPSNTVVVNGSILVADSGNNRIRSTSLQGAVDTVTGSSGGFLDGPRASALFLSPQGIAATSQSWVVVGDYLNHRIRLLSPSGMVSTLAGQGSAAWADGIGTNARFNSPNSLAVDAGDNIYVADQANSRIRMVTLSGNTITIAGNGAFSYADGIGTNARFNRPMGVALNNLQKIYVADAAGNRIRVVSQPSLLVTTLAGSGSGGFSDGVGTSSAFNAPYSLALDDLSNVFVADYNNKLVRKVTPAGVVTTVAGTFATCGAVDGYSTSATVCSIGISSQVGGNFVLSDLTSSTIRQLTCVPCPASYYCFSGTPVLCLAGSYCPLSSINATACPKGTYSNTGASSCTICPAGSFTSATGSTSCQQCPGGHFCPTGTSSWARLNCGRGNYCPDGSGAPTPCPYQVPPTGGWGALQVQGPAFLVETAHCLNHCFWNFTSGDGMLSKC